MAEIALEFIAPSNPDIVKLLIYESPTQDGIFTLIDEVDDVGTHPDYINHYTTANASSVDNWFSIQWVDSKGAASPLSDPWQGNTESLVSIVSGRVVQRGVTADESVILQEAEAVIEGYYNGDPYEVPFPVNYRTISGLTYLVMARLMVLDIITDTTSTYTAGIIAQQETKSTQALDKVQKLLDAANQLLGRNYSVVLQMTDYNPVCEISESTFDQSRLIVELT